VFRVEQTIKHAPYIKGFDHCFATFTYNEQNLPLSEHSKYPTLLKKHLINHVKRYNMLCQRKYGKGMFPPLKFIRAGEYGTLTNRPHYHMIAINADIKLLEKSWSIRGKPLGNVQIETTFKSNAIGYTTKYISKLENDQHNYKHVEPEFVSWSRGLGKEFLTPQMLAWFHADPTNRNTIPLLDGAKMHLPRYYANKIEFTEWDKFQQSKKSKEYREEKNKELLQNYAHVSDDPREQMRAIHLNNIEANKLKIKKQKSDQLLKMRKKVNNL
jgi:hypothetical protein